MKLELKCLQRQKQYLSLVDIQNILNIMKRKKA